MKKLTCSQVRQELKVTFISFLIWIPIVVILFPFYLLCFIVSSVVHLIAKLFRPDLIPITRIDAFLAFAPSRSPNSYAYTCQILKVNGVVDVSVFRNYFYELFLANEEDREKYRNFFCYFVTFFNFVFKKRLRSIDLDYQIQKLELREGQTVEDFVGRWMVEHDIDPSGKERPDWLVKIIPHYSSNNQTSTTVVLKLNHGLCDGYTMVHLLGKLCGAPAPYLFKEPVPSILKRVRCSLKKLNFQFHLFTV